MTDGFPVPGEVFEGRYRISTLIGSGGFARVYSAVQEDLGRDVTIKILMPATTSDGSQYSEKIVRRFNQEARLVSRLRDPHTITMFDYGETTNGLLYMVFEYIQGRSLSQIVHEDGAIAYDRVAKVLEATLSSLQEAHAFGVLHRDIKPGNIMLFDYLGRPDQVKLLDFGIAKSLSDQVPGKDITADGALVGTPRYMSPEQIRGRELGPASDIYSLGLVAFEMLTGAKAIESNSSVTIIGRQLDTAPFLVPDELDVPTGLREIVNRMMAKEIDDRYDTAEAVLDDLRAWREGTFKSRMAAADDELPEVDVEPVDGGPVADYTFDYDPPDNRKKIAGIIGACILLVGSIVVMLIVGSNDDTSAEEAPTDGVAIAAESAANDVTEESEEVAASADDDQVTAKTVRIVTVPAVAKISIDGRSLGESPTQASIAEDEFPITITAKIGDKELNTTLEAYKDEVMLDVNELVEKTKVAATEKNSGSKTSSKSSSSNSRPKKESKPTKPRVTKKTVKETKKTKPEPAEKEEKPSLSIPALD